LVVIAIIAILAAILFPVFAQAKAAAKTSVALSNTKQIGLGEIMYIGDFDDTYPARRSCLQTTPTTIYSWKQAIYPYVKNTGLFTDTVNPAAKFLDDTSEPLILAADGHMLPAQSHEPQFARGYQMNNIGFYLQGQWDNFGPCDDPSTHPGYYQNVFSQSQIDQVAQVAGNWEGKQEWVDTGSYIGWGSVGADDDGVTRIDSTQWNWGGGKWGEKAMAMTYLDGHSKRTAHSAICGIPHNQVTPFGWVYNDLSNHAPGGDMTWLDTYCQTMPAVVK